MIVSNAGGKFFAVIELDQQMDISVHPLNTEFTLLLNGVPDPVFANGFTDPTHVGVYSTAAYAPGVTVSVEYPNRTPRLRTLELYETSPFGPLTAVSP